jgi:hypothetical protein
MLACGFSQSSACLFTCLSITKQVAENKSINSFSFCTRTRMQKYLSLSHCTRTSWPPDNATGTVHRALTAHALRVACPNARRCIKNAGYQGRGQSVCRCRASVRPCWTRIVSEWGRGRIASRAPFLTSISRPTSQPVAREKKKGVFSFLTRNNQAHARKKGHLCEHSAPNPVSSTYFIVWEPSRPYIPAFQYECLGGAIAKCSSHEKKFLLITPPFFSSIKRPQGPRIPPK